MKTITWEQLLQNPRIVGAEIRIKIFSRTYCGRIERVTIEGVEGSNIVFHLAWSADYDENGCCWVVNDTYEITLDKDGTNVELGDLGKYTLTNPHINIGSILLYPRDQVNPEHVRGLDLKKRPLS